MKLIVRFACLILFSLQANADKYGIDEPLSDIGGGDIPAVSLVLGVVFACYSGYKMATDIGSSSVGDWFLVLWLSFSVGCIAGVIISFFFG